MKEFNLDFFEYSKGCKEYHVLNDVVSDYATRNQIRNGNLLFIKVHTNILAMDTPLQSLWAKFFNNPKKIFKNYFKIRGYQLIKNY